MKLEGIIWKMHNWSEWITRIMYVNLLWILFSLAGLVVFGAFPATAAMFSVTRKWVLGEQVPVFGTFWESYKADFVQTNLLGYVSGFIGFFIYMDLRFSQTSHQFIFHSVSFLFLILLFVYFVVLLYIFPVFAHYKFKTFEYLKYSLVIAIGKPLQTIMMVISGLLVLLLVRLSPVLILFVTGGLMSVVLTLISMRSFPKKTVQQKSDVFIQN